MRKVAGLHAQGLIFHNLAHHAVAHKALGCWAVPVPGDAWDPAHAEGLFQHLHALSMSLPSTCSSVVQRYTAVLPHLLIIVV